MVGSDYNRTARGERNECADHDETDWALKERARDGKHSDQVLICRRCGATRRVPDRQLETAR